MRYTHALIHTRVLCTLFSSFPPALFPAFAAFVPRKNLSLPRAMHSAFRGLDTDSPALWEFEKRVRSLMDAFSAGQVLAFDPKTQRFVVIRIPYPLNTYTRGLDGRIDDPTAGWKGRGVWFTNGLDPLIHSEVQKSYLGWVQFRPDPLAD
jgi:hypothetical protein